MQFLEIELLQNVTFSELCEDIKTQILRYVDMVRVLYESYGVQTKSRSGSLASPRNRPHPQMYCVVVFGPNC